MGTVFNLANRRVYDKAAIEEQRAASSLATHFGFRDRIPTREELDGLQNQWRAAGQPMSGALYDKLMQISYARNAGAQLGGAYAPNDALRPYDPTATNTTAAAPPTTTAQKARVAASRAAPANRRQQQQHPHGDASFVGFDQALQPFVRQADALIKGGTGNSNNSIVINNDGTFTWTDPVSGKKHTQKNELSGVNPATPPTPPTTGRINTSGMSEEQAKRAMQEHVASLAGPKTGTLDKAAPFVQQQAAQQGALSTQQPNGALGSNSTAKTQNRQTQIRSQAAGYSGNRRWHPFSGR